MACRQMKAFIDQLLDNVSQPVVEEMLRIFLSFLILGRSFIQS